MWAHNGQFIILKRQESVGDGSVGIVVEAWEPEFGSSVARSLPDMAASAVCVCNLGIQRLQRQEDPRGPLDSQSSQIGEFQVWWEILT